MKVIMSLHIGLGRGALALGIYVYMSVYNSGSSVFYFLSENRNKIGEMK
jgi:hypothetical protein